MKVKSLKSELFAAQDAALEADITWQAELDKQGIERYSKRAQGAANSPLRGLYDAKVATANKQAEITNIMRRYQDVEQIARP